MTAKVIALYNEPQNAELFDLYYFDRHVPLAKTLPGLKRYEVNVGKITDTSGASPFHLAAILSFDSLSDIQSAMASEEGLATAADLQNFATSGVSLLILETHEI